MKLVRFGPKGREKPGLIDGQGQLRDLSKKIKDITAETLSPQGLRKLKALDPKRLPAVRGKPRLGVPFTGIGKIVCVGLNYRKHAEETNSPIPGQPITFLKAITALSGPFDPVEIPKDSEKTDWEVELGIVIGRKAKYVSEEKALDFVAGYCVVNDVSERRFQIEMGGNWSKGKSADTFAPVGPWLVTKDEIKDPNNLELWLELNGKRLQHSNTSDMIFNCKQIVSYISRFMTLMPGDVIPTGTPSGVGMGQKPTPFFLKSGDVMRLSIEGLGVQQLKAKAYSGR
jgi:2,4-didehydro-3-deoxy-L-rhamnonate hydrolase